jgi:hypothetical protein
VQHDAKRTADRTEHFQHVDDDGLLLWRDIDFAGDRHHAWHGSAPSLDGHGFLRRLGAPASTVNRYCWSPVPVSPMTTTAR